MFIKIKGFALFAVLVCMTAGIMLFVRHSQAGKSIYWVTVDAEEFAKVQNSLAQGDETGLKTAEVVFSQNGIAVLRLNDQQRENLSSAMHDSFHKCSGFMAHETSEKAIDQIMRESQVNAFEQFVDYTIDNQANVTPLLAEAAETSTRETIIHLSTQYPTRRHNSATGLNSATWIKDKWTQLTAGRSDVTVEFVTHTNTPQPSVVMTIQGATIPNEIVVLGGHQDSIAGSVVTNPAPGADDDASGIASLTETIRVLMAKNFKPNRTVQFMAYAAEEVGLLGSAAIAANYRAQNKNVVGVLQLDMTNYKGSQFDIVMIQDRTNAAQNTFVTNLVTTYQPSLAVGTASCGYGCSDHSSWNAQSYPASFPFEATLTTDNPTIHSANDTISQSGNNANHALKFTKLGLSFVGELAKGSIAAPRKTAFDFDGDSKTDLSVFRAALGEWWINRSATAQTFAAQFGVSSDKAVPADYTGDGKSDVAIFRPSTGEWYILRSENGSYFSIAFGQPGDIPVPADYDNDGKMDAAVFRPSSGTWFVLNSSGIGVSILNFGVSSDKPVPADYDGDGKADIAIFRPSDGSWWYLRSSDAQFRVFRFGTSSDKAVPADFTGDGKADIAVYRPSTGEWFIQRSEDNSFYTINFGASGDLPVPGDYDGDGKTDAAVFRPSDSNWYVLRSTSGLLIQHFGLSSDLPLPNVYVP